VALSRNESTPAELAADLAALGVRRGDLLMVHASLRALGPIEGRAGGVVDALDAAVGPEGTLLMTLGARNDFDWVNERPEAEREALLLDAEPFDALRTPAQPDVGYLAEAFRTRAGTRVTDHPEGRFGARGAHAEELLASPPWHDYYGPGSALERFHRRSGRVLRLGASIETVTLLHYAEYVVPLEEKRRTRRHRRVKRADGSLATVHIECLDDEHGIVDYPDGDYFGFLLHDYLATGQSRAGTVGRAHSELIEAPDLLEFAVRWMAEKLTPRT
jgi:aminoglycoside N3'-acetyltransferase